MADATAIDTSTAKQTINAYSETAKEMQNAIGKANSANPASGTPEGLLLNTTISTNNSQNDVINSANGVSAGAVGTSPTQIQNTVLGSVQKKANSFVQNIAKSKLTATIAKAVTTTITTQLVGKLTSKLGAVGSIISNVAGMALGNAVSNGIMAQALKNNKVTAQQNSMFPLKSAVECLSNVNNGNGMANAVQKFANNNVTNVNKYDFKNVIKSPTDSLSKYKSNTKQTLLGSNDKNVL